MPRYQWAWMDDKTWCMIFFFKLCQSATFWETRMKYSKFAREMPMTNWQEISENPLLANEPGTDSLCQGYCESPRQWIMRRLRNLPSSPNRPSYSCTTFGNRPGIALPFSFFIQRMCLFIHIFCSSTMYLPNDYIHNLWDGWRIGEWF